jgi:hypothetical protein
MSNGFIVPHCPPSTTCIFINSSDGFWMPVEPTPTQIGRELVCVNYQRLGSKICGLREADPTFSFCEHHKAKERSEPNIIIKPMYRSLNEAVMAAANIILYHVLQDSTVEYAIAIYENENNECCLVETRRGERSSVLVDNDVKWLPGGYSFKANVHSHPLSGLDMFSGHDYILACGDKTQDKPYISFLVGFAWSRNRIYKEGEIVTNGGKHWIAIKNANGKGIVPSDNSPLWEQVEKCYGRKRWKEGHIYNVGEIVYYNRKHWEAIIKADKAGISPSNTRTQIWKQIKWNVVCSKCSIKKGGVVGDREAESPFWKKIISTGDFVAEGMLGCIEYHIPYYDWHGTLKKFTPPMYNGNINREKAKVLAIIIAALSSSDEFWYEDWGYRSWGGLWEALRRQYLRLPLVIPDNYGMEGKDKIVKYLHAIHPEGSYNEAIKSLNGKLEQTDIVKDYSQEIKWDNLL